MADTTILREEHLRKYFSTNDLIWLVLELEERCNYYRERYKELKKCQQ